MSPLVYCKEGIARITDCLGFDQCLHSSLLAYLWV